MRVLQFNYTCEPGRGSEPGAGWGLLEAVSSFADSVVALVGPEGTEAIRRWERNHPAANVEFVEVPEPRWWRLAKKHRISHFVLYLRWLRTARSVAERLIRERGFDVVHHATFSTYWLPSPAVTLGLPSVWGPVGGGVRTPPSLKGLLGAAGRFGDVLDAVGVAAMERLPATRRTWRDATVTIVQNEQTRRRLGDAGRDVVVLNHALFHRVEAEGGGGRPEAGSPLVWVGALESRKGPELVVRALARASATVEVVGDGPERRRIEELAARLGVADRVTFTGWIPREEVLRRLARTPAAIFTGVREEGGLALAESLFLGVPVIVLDHGGAGAIARAASDPAMVSLVPVADADAVVAGLASAMDDHAADPRPRAGALLSRRAAIDALAAAFGDAVR